VVSFAKQRRSKPQSFPRKRESTPQTLGDALSKDWIPAFAGMTSIGRFSNDQEVALPLNPLSSESADCRWSEGSPALRYLPPLSYNQPSINHLSFQLHFGFGRISTFIFIHIPALPASFPQRSFVFIEIPASYVQF
jgi:hypothetical protein